MTASTFHTAATTFHPIIISAPFGNYIQPAGTTATLGTFTAAARSGRVWRILKTVRYYRRIGAWVNKIGLRNPGIEWVMKRVEAGRLDVKDKIISIHGFTEADWWLLLDRIAAIKPLAVELNMSCPNVGCIEWPVELFERSMATGVTVIAKLPPVNYEEIFRQAWAAGVRWFHCCNTLPNPAGGISGEPLKPVALQCIRDIRQNLLDEAGRQSVRIIGGGGIDTATDIERYAQAGANRFALGTKLFHPRYLIWHDRIQPLKNRAAELVRG
jgi:dihydroorotate dehydrogenase